MSSSAPLRAPRCPAQASHRRHLFRVSCHRADCVPENLRSQSPSPWQRPSLSPPTRSGQHPPGVSSARDSASCQWREAHDPSSKRAEELLSPQPPGAEGRPRKIGLTTWAGFTSNFEARGSSFISAICISNAHPPLSPRLYLWVINKCFLSPCTSPHGTSWGLLNVRPVTSPGPFPLAGDALPPRTPALCSGWSLPACSPVLQRLPGRARALRPLVLVRAWSKQYRITADGLSLLLILPPKTQGNHLTVSQCPHC